MLEKKREKDTSSRVEKLKVQAHTIAMVCVARYPFSGNYLPNDFIHYQIPDSLVRCHQITIAMFLSSSDPVTHTINMVH